MDVAFLGVAQEGGSLVSFLMPLVVIFAIFYFLVIRPQNKQRRLREQMLQRMKKGDRVVTNGGLLGTVSGVKDGVVTLLVSDKVRVRVLLSQIAGPEDDFIAGGASGSKSDASSSSSSSSDDEADESGADKKKS